MTRVKAPTGTEAYQPPGSASGSRGYDANGSLYDSEHGWLVGGLARASLPGPARFLAGGKNRTALLSAQGCRAARLPVSAVQAAQHAQRSRQARYWIVTFIQRLTARRR